MLTLGDAGLICSEGALWKEHRRFVVGVMKELGMGRSGDGRALMEARIMDRVVEFVQVSVPSGNGVSISPAGGTPCLIGRRVCVGPKASRSIRCPSCATASATSWTASSSAGTTPRTTPPGSGCRTCSTAASNTWPWPDRWTFCPSSGGRRSPFRFSPNR